jgi:hypothetical protein
MTRNNRETWDSNAEDDVTAALATAQFDPSSEAVTLRSRWGGAEIAPITFTSLRDVDDALVELAEARQTVEAPSDGGKLAVTLDPQRIVDKLLPGSEVARFFNGY